MFFKVKLVLFILKHNYVFGESYHVTFYNLNKLCQIVILRDLLTLTLNREGLRGSFLNYHFLSICILVASLDFDLETKL